MVYNGCMKKTLREWRIARLLGVKALARVAGVSNKTVVDIEYGRVTPKLRTIRRICAALNVAPSDVIEFQAAMQQLARPAELNGDPE
jgi:DNA-binding XRE family transcriptional regulator